MFGKNEIIGQKYFEPAQDNLFITSIFYTLQGEGPFSGRPAVFIRLAKCNLACGFCDTFFDDGAWLSVLEIRVQIAELLQGVDLSKIGIVITGGEPMLQKNITMLCEALVDAHAFVQIESNGTVYQDLPERVVLVVSPKCATNTQYLKPHKRNLERANCLKFVVTHDDASPYHTLPDWAFAFERDVYISPMNMYNQQRHVGEVSSFWQPDLLNREANQKNHEYAALYCLEHQLILSLQTHLYAGIA